ncbi:MAG: hypothetical protein HYR91_08390 [Flavobacteriia bacterium]|nr:hypothetical protein [Flavobacteriia bacterium]
MIDLKTIKSTYQNMYDNELIEFAKTRYDFISSDVKKILIDELSKRNIELDFITEIEKTKQEEFELKLKQKEIELDGNTNPFLFPFWHFAIEQFYCKKTVQEVKAMLKDKNLTDERIEEIFKRIPFRKEKIKPSFLQIVSEKIELSTMSVKGGSFIFLIGGITFCIVGVTLPMAAVFLIGVTFAFWGGWSLISGNNGQSKGHEYWTQKIKNKPEDIVWIKPIVEKTKLYFVLTISKIYKFQLYTVDGKSATFTCDKANEQKILFDGIKHYLPHIHIGYTEDILLTYEFDPQQFLINIEKKGLYKPIDSYPL